MAGKTKQSRSPPEAGEGQAQRCAPAGATNFGAGAHARGMLVRVPACGVSGRGKFLVPGADVPSTAIGIQPCNRERQPRRKKTCDRRPHPALWARKKRTAILLSRDLRAARPRTFWKLGRTRMGKIGLAPPRQRADSSAARPRSVGRPRSFSFPRLSGRSITRSQSGAPMAQARERSAKRGRGGEAVMASRPALFVETRIDLRHQNRAEREFSGFRFPRQTAQVAASGSDRGAALQDARDDNRGRRFA